MKKIRKNVCIYFLYVGKAKMRLYQYHVHLFLKKLWKLHLLHIFLFLFFFLLFRKISKETTKCCFKNCSQQSCVIFTEFSTEEPSLRIINTTDEIFGETKSVRPSVGRTFFYYYFKVCVLLSVVAWFEIGKSPRARNSRAPTQYYQVILRRWSKKMKSDV